MNTQQLFDLYASQDVYMFNIATYLRKMPEITLNWNSLVFFVLQFLDEYEQLDDALDSSIPDAE